jgi:hypothetical protein
MIVTTVLLDGPRHAILHFEISTNEETAAVLIDPTTLTPPCSKLVVEDVLFDFAGFDAKMFFPSDVAEGIMTWVLPEGGANYADFRPFGGFKDRSGINGDGKLKLTTYGIDGGDIGTMIVRVRKAA